MKPKILHISCGGLLEGGVTKVILFIADSLHNHYQFDCMVFDTPSLYESVWKKYGKISRLKYVYTIKKSKFKYLLLLFRPLILYCGVYHLCKETNYQAIHCHNMYDQWVCLLAAKHARVPIRIAHSHTAQGKGELSYLKRMYKQFNKVLVNYSSNVRIGCSRKACINYFGSRVSSSVIYNPVDTKKFCISGHIPSTSLTFIHVGRYTKIKNQEFVIDVFRHIIKKQTASKLLLVGSGEDRECLIKKINEYNLEQNIDLLVSTSNEVSKLYARADYMIFPSKSEGLGIALIEAQSMGVFCYASDTVPDETDLGLIEYLNIGKGPQFWANRILNDIEKHHIQNYKLDKNKLARFSVDIISDNYKQIYSGKTLC